MWKNTEYIVAFLLQQWLRERATITLYVHCLFCSTVGSEWLALLPGKELPIHIRYEAGCVPEHV